MPQRNSFSSKSVLLIFLLIFGICWKLCDSQVNREETNNPPDSLDKNSDFTSQNIGCWSTAASIDGHGGDDGAFFALRSCHQLLHGDTGEFFSPDYLCSNPPLWCNWTIQVNPGKRVHLHLEDLTPDDACHLKQDQVHVDEPAGHFGGHKILQKCWREAKYTSSSSTLYVVLLIGGWPSPPYRGFYGRYQAFGPPVVYNPQEGFTNRKSEPSPGLMNEAATDGDQMDSQQQPSPATSDLMYDYYNQASVMTAELPWEPEGDSGAETDEHHHPSSQNYSHVSPLTAAPTVPASTQGTRWGRGATRTASGSSESSVHPASPQQQPNRQSQELQPTTSTPTTHREEAAAAEEESSTPRPSEEEKSADGENSTEVSRGASDQLPPHSDGPGPGPEKPEQTHPHPNMVEQLSDHRGNLHVRNHSEGPHLPGDHLFEVAVEVNFSQDLEESWDNLVRALLLSVKALISEQLEALSTPPSMSPKRIKRLSAGVLYILWLQIGQGSGGLHVHGAVHSAMQGLIATDVSVRGNYGEAFITSVSTADVNECGTQLVLCDINADCVNRFGSYSCHCRPGFQDESRLGSGGTVCVDVKAAGCSSGLSTETKAVYVLFFLLSSLVLMLLVAAGLLYHRHHRGAFLVHCRSCSSISPPGPNNNNNHEDSYSSPADSDLPPPPPPVRGFREGWPQVKERCPAMDLPLLRFSPLLPPDGFMEPQEGGKM